MAPNKGVIILHTINKKYMYFFSENKAIGVMKPGHCFTIEPMINEGKVTVIVS